MLRLIDWMILAFPQVRRMKYTDAVIYGFVSFLFASIGLLL